MAEVNDDIEFIRTYKAVQRTGISLTQLKRYAKEGRIKIHRPSPKVALIRWKELLALIEG